MTPDMMNFRDFVEKAPDADLDEWLIHYNTEQPHPQHNHECRLIMTSGHLGIYTSLTEVTT